MQGAEIEDEGSVLTYMTKSEIEEQRSSLLIMTQRREGCDLWEGGEGNGFLFENEPTVDVKVHLTFSA